MNILCDVWDEQRVRDLISGPTEDFLKCGGWVPLSEIIVGLRARFPDQTIPYYLIIDAIDGFGSDRVQIRMVDGVEEMRRTTVTCDEHDECRISKVHQFW